MLKSLLFMFFTAGALGYPLQAEKPEQPKEIYRIRTVTLDAVKQDITAVYQYIDQSNLPQQEAKQLKATLADAANRLDLDRNDSTLNR